MNPDRRHATAAVKQVVARAVDYELSLAVQIRRSERRAWWVAAVSVAMSAILALGYWVVMPLKQTQPYLVMADPHSGHASLARLQASDVTSSEALDRANVAAFIRARESYDWTQIGARDWSTVFTMAEDEVSAEYRALYRQDNPKGPLSMYGKGQAIRIRILSIQLFGRAAGDGTGGATVRFQRSVFDKMGGASRLLDNRIATLEYGYKANLVMAEEDRLLNPLGFRVGAYRVDNDYTHTPSADADSIASGAQTTVEAARSVSPGKNASGRDVP